MGVSASVFSSCAWTPTATPCGLPAAPHPQHIRGKKLVEKAHQLQIVDRLEPVAQELGCSMAQASGRGEAAAVRRAGKLERGESVQEELQALAP